MQMRTIPLLLLFLLVTVSTSTAFAAQNAAVRNGGFESVDTQSGFASDWIRGFGAETKASAEIDHNMSHGGACSLKISDSTPTAAYRYAIVNSSWVPVSASTTYRLRLWMRGHNVGKFMVGAGFEGAGEYRVPVAVGDYDWREVSVRITTPEVCSQLTIQFVADGVTDAIWIDDVRLERSELQFANLTEPRRTGSLKSWFPRTPGPLPTSLTVADISHESTDVCGVLTALQGIVNRKRAQLYLINPTNPPGYDNMWLRYLQEKSYTGAERRLEHPLDAIKQFRQYISGVVVWDPALPGSINAAWMLAGVQNLLPCSPTMATRLDLPIVEDLQGRWRRNVDAFRYVYDRYWSVMSHELLAWEYPLSNALTSRDYMVQNRVFLFWASAPGDHEVGADPEAEMELIEELLSRTPGNVPVMGWPQYVDVNSKAHGLEEYAAVRLLSEYGKWVPGTGYNSNVTVHSAVTPPPSVFHQNHPAASEVKYGQTDRDAVYLTINIMDSGDAHWYWQFHQQRIWADANRGAVPTGYGMNPTLIDALPDVAQWYFEHRAPGDTLFGLIYMNTQVYASRFKPADRERIWTEYVQLFDSYRKRLDMDGIELYNGGNGGTMTPDSLYHRFTGGMHGLRYILADLGRHSAVDPDHSVFVIDGTVVFHTLTNFRIWSTPEEVVRRTMEDENGWLRDEIVSHTPHQRPAFFSALAISWYYFPSWIKDFSGRLPRNYRLVSPDELTLRYLSNRKSSAP